MTFDINKGYCCDLIEDVVQQLPYDKGYSSVIPLSYSASRRLFILEDCPPVMHKNEPRKEGERRVGFQIDYCPWCGSKFPQDLTEIWYAILKADYDIDATDSTQLKNIPQEFKTDEWWKKRGL